MTPPTKRSLAMLHTVTGLVPVFEDLVKRHLPDWQPFNIVDESLLRNTIKIGRLTPETMRRLAGHVWSAVDAGAEAILVTCSSLGPAVDATSPFCPVPLFRVDVGMVDEALGKGARIGVLATLQTTLEPTENLIRARAALRGKDVDIEPVLVHGAFELLGQGDRNKHDALIVSSAQALSEKVDVLVLAQASMARALESPDAAKMRCITLSSPELGVVSLKRFLEAMV